MRIFRGELRDTVDLLVFGPGERLAAAASGRDKVDVWNCVTGQLADPWRSRNHDVGDLGFLPDGRVVACVHGRSLQVFDPNATGQHGIVFPSGRHKQALGPAVHLAVGPDAVYSTHTHNPHDVLAKPTLVRWQPNGADAYALAWSAEAGTTDGPLPVAASPDGRQVAYVGTFGGWWTDKVAIVILDAGTGTEVRRISISWRVRSAPPRLRFSPDGTRILATPDAGVCIWDMATGEQVGRLGEPTALSALADAVFHPSGRWLMTNWFHGQVQVWDAERLTPVTAFDWKAGYPGSLAISADGNLAAAGGENGNIVVWDWDL